jgi:hypothetical protein
MIKEKNWIEFKDSGLLWWINRLLHTFGWSIVYIYDEEGSFAGALPAKTSFQGFSRESEERGFERIKKLMKEMVNE